MAIRNNILFLMYRKHTNLVKFLKTQYYQDQLWLKSQKSQDLRLQVSNLTILYHIP